MTEYGGGGGGGGGGFDGGTISGSALVIDLDDAEALLVRKAEDAGDVFLVDTVAAEVGFETWVNLANGNNLVVSPRDAGGTLQTLTTFDPDTPSVTIPSGVDFLPGGSFTITIGSGASGDTYSIAIGDAAAAPGNTGVAIGRNASVPNDAGAGIAIGPNAAISSGNVAGDALAIGSSAVAHDASCLAIGGGAVAGAANKEAAIAIGDSANAAQAKSIAIGVNAAAIASGAQDDSIVVGYSASSASFRTIVIGNDVAIPAACEGVYIGDNLDETLLSNDDSNVVIGGGAKIAASDAVVVGDGAQVTANSGVAVGQLAVAFANGALALGQSARADQSYSIALGADSDTSAANQLWIGAHNRADTRKINEVVIDAGEQANLVVTNASDVETTLLELDPDTPRVRITSGVELSFGSHTAIGSETLTGYITITDAGGTTRKLAVVSVA